MMTSTILIVIAIAVWSVIGVALYMDLENRWFWFWVEDIGVKAAHRRELSIWASAACAFIAGVVGPFMYIVHKTFRPKK